jgi:glutathione S-transferase
MTITLYSHKKAPNGWVRNFCSSKRCVDSGSNPQKAAIILEELGIKYETKYLEFGTAEPGIKGPEHVKLNPNGRKLL